MSETRSEVLTFEDYRNYRLAQDKDIGREFERLHTKIEEGNESLRVELTTTEGTLSGGLNRLNNELGKVKVDLHNLKNEVSQVKDEVSQVKDEVSQLRARLDQMDGRSYNKMRFLPRHNIAKIGAYRPSTGFEMPSYFPGTIDEFWRLQLQQNEEKLIYLIQFFDVHGYKHWGEAIHDFDESPDTGSDPTSESDDSSQDTLSLEDAIRKYPIRAIEELAALLGIIFEKIREFYSKLAKYRQRPQQQAVKRQVKEVDVYTADLKRAKKLELPFSPKANISFPPQSVRQIPSTPTDSPHTKLGWDLESTQRRGEALLRREDPGSTTEEILSQTSQERLRNRKKGSQNSPR